MHFDSVATDMIQEARERCQHKLQAATAASVVYILPPGGQRFFPNLQRFAEAAVASAGLRAFGTVALLNTTAEVESFATFAREQAANSTDAATWSSLGPDTRAEINVRTPPDLALQVRAPAR